MASKSLSFDVQMQIRSLCLNNYNNIITKPYSTSMVADDVRWVSLAVDNFVSETASTYHPGVQAVQFSK